MNILALSILAVALISIITFSNVCAQETKGEISDTPTKGRMHSLVAAGRSIAINAVLVDEQLRQQLLHEYRKRKRKREWNGHLSGAFVIHFDARGFVEYVVNASSLDNRVLEKEIIDRIEHCHSRGPDRLREGCIYLKVDDIIAEALKMSTAKKG